MSEAKSKYNMNLILLSEDDVENMMVGAIEGGSNYWYLIKEKADATIRKATEEMKGEPLVMRMLTAIARGVAVDIHDLENEDELLGTLTSTSWTRGEKLLMTKEYKMHLAEILGENDDASTADVFFQLCLLGEIVYG